MSDRNKFVRHAVLVLCGGFAVAVAVSACGGDSKTASPTAPSSSSTTVVAPSAAASQASAATPVALPSSAAPAGPVTFSVLAGKAQGAMDIEMFMPAEIRIREGDTIEWTAQGFEGHSITFGTAQQIKDVFAEYLQPDPENPSQKVFNTKASLHSATGETFAGDETFTNSGFIGVPAESKYKLTFTKRGVYEYLCLVHPFTMFGTVSVDAPDAKVDAPATVAARGQADLARFIAAEEREVDDASAIQRSFPTIGTSYVHRVAVGLTTPYGQIATYVKPVLDIKAGDTVIFASDDRDFHNVVFKGAKELPAGVGLKPDPAGRGGFILALSNESAIGVDPPPGFDDKTFMSSGSMGVTQSRLSWTLRFDKPGTYIYNCTIHVLAGMAGVINVR
jgi:plastocyanin